MRKCSKGRRFSTVYALIRTVYRMDTLTCKKTLAPVKARLSREREMEEKRKMLEGNHSEQESRLFRPFELTAHGRRRPPWSCNISQFLDEQGNLQPPRQDVPDFGPIDKPEVPSYIEIAVAGHM